MRRGYLSLLALLALLVASWTGCSSVPELPAPCITASKPEALGGRTVLVAVAHQDDEVFIAARIRKHIESRDRVYVVWSARSDLRGRDYADIRIRESKSAMALIGISEQNSRYLNYPDSETHKNMAAIIVDMKKILREIKPDIIYIPAFETGHIDHDTIHFSVWRAHRELAHTSIIHEFPLYNAFDTSSLFPFTMRALPPGRPMLCRILSEPEYQSVLSYWNVYKSQHSRLGWYISLVEGKRKTFGVEYFRPLPEYSYTQKPVDGDIAYERFLKKSTFQQFKEAVEKNAQIFH